MVVIANLTKLENVGFTINGAEYYYWTGHSISNIGDVNGDGVCDFLIATRSDIRVDHGYSSVPGSVYVIFGKERTELFPPVIDLSHLEGVGCVVTGAIPGDNFGWRGSPLGDINGDGINDFIVGAGNADPNGVTDGGKAYVFFGRLDFPTELSVNDLNGSNGFTINGEQYYGYLGYTASATGDVNGDGVNDIIIGASSAFHNVGYVYVIYGKSSSSSFSSIINVSSLNRELGYKITSGMSNTSFGEGLSIGDINNDGIDDIIIAERMYGGESGRVVVVWGKETLISETLSVSTMTQEIGFSIESSFSNGRTGEPVSVGDFNGDGIGDIIFGSYILGKVFVVFGKTESFPISFTTSDLKNGVGFTITKVNGGQSNDQFGGGMLGVKDLNKDGIDDMLVSAPGEDAGGIPNSGRVYLFLGNKHGFPDVIEASTSNNGTIDGIIPNSGVTATTIGDINNDGYEEIALSSMNASPNGINSAGQVYVIFTKNIFDKCKKIIDGTNFILTKFNDKISFNTKKLYNLDCGDGEDVVVLNLEHPAKIDFVKESISVGNVSAKFKNCEILELTGPYDADVILGAGTSQVHGNNKTTVFHTDEENECITLTGINTHSFDLVTHNINLITYEDGLMLV